MRRFTLQFQTSGNNDVINLSDILAQRIASERAAGLIHLFVVGSTAALACIEFESQLIKHDLPALLQRLIPDDARYEHEATWNDDNGHSHLRTALIGPSLTVPFADGRLLTGEYQQVALIDFDTRPRRRDVIATVII